MMRFPVASLYGGEIHGSVYNATPDLSEDFFRRLEEALESGSNDTFEKALTSMRSFQVLENAIVTAQGEYCIRRTVSDADGKFIFKDLPKGFYEVWAESSAPPPSDGIKIMASPSTHLRVVENNGLASLAVRADHVIVTGQIVDEAGRPIINARVTGIQEIDDPSCMHEPKTVTSYSDSNGFYVLQGLAPPDIWRSAGYLNGGNPTLDLHSFYLSVHVESNGFIQKNENVPRIPLVTENLLCKARHLLRILNELETRTKGTSEIAEKGGLVFPNSQGDLIPGVNVKLSKSDIPIPL